MADKVKKCIIVSGAPESDLSYYTEYLNGVYIICADSGYLKCRLLGVKPDLIVGDFDSSHYPQEDCEIIKLNVRKDDSDTFDCVKQAVSRGYGDITILGGIGSRADHTYSNILSAVYCFDRKVKCRLINEKNRISVKSGSFVIKKGKYKYFSMFALFEKCEGLTIKGSQYDLDGVELLPSSQLNQSNEFLDDKVTVEIKSGKIILIQSND